MSPSQIIIIFFILLAFGIIIFPLINRKQFKNLSWEQKICMLMKEANSLAYLKNVSQGSKGSLYYVKNKRKILELNWILIDGKMICTKENPTEKWDYPEEQEPLTDEEKAQFFEALNEYNRKSAIKFVITK